MRKLCMVLAVALMAGTVTGCRSSETAGGTAPPMPDAVGKHPGVQMQLNVRAPMRDGVNLVADVFTPDGPGPYPVVLTRTPYDKTGAQMGGIIGAQRGFIMVDMDVRGRYRSPGTWYPFKYEIQDGYDSVEWAAKLPKSNGKVGMYGGSYVGATQWLAALDSPPHLVAIMPALTPDDYFEDWGYQHGAFQQWFVQSWVSQTAGEELSRLADLGFSPGGYVAKTRNAKTGMLEEPGRVSLTNPMDYAMVLPLGNYTSLTAPPIAGEAGNAVLQPWYLDWLKHPTNDAYWQQWAAAKDFSRIKAQVFIVTGWYDLFEGGALDSYAGVKAHGGTDAARNVHLLIAPGGHSGDEQVGVVNFGKAAAVDTPPTGGHGGSEPVTFNVMLDWYNQILRDPPQNNNATTATWKNVRYFEMGTNQWKMSDTWPPPEAKTVAYYLHSAGKANTASGNGGLSTGQTSADAKAASDTFVYDPSNPKPTLGGAMCCDGHDTPNGVQDQRPDEQRPDVLVFSTPVLTQNLNVTGPVSMTLYVSSSAPDTDFTAVLVDVAPDGTAHNIANGIVRMRYRDTDTKATFMTPGQTYKVNVDMWATSNVFLAGHRLRVDVSSSDFPLWDRNLNTTESPERGTHWVKATNVIYHDAEHPSSLNLSVMPQ